MPELRDANGLTEAEYLRQYNPDKYPKPSLTADIIVFSREANSQQRYILLVRRGNHPFLGFWALPGGFANANECIEDTAARELLEETGIPSLNLFPVGLYSKPGRDPRGWVVSQCYCAEVKREKLTVQAGDDAADVDWFPVHLTDGRVSIQDSDGNSLPLAFDHEEMIGKALSMIE